MKLVQYLDEYVVGQENAKKVLSVAYVLASTSVGSLSLNV